MDQKPVFPFSAAPRAGFNQKVYNVVRRIPRGRVLSYGSVARLVGNPRASRAVGYAAVSAPAELPYHRVVYKDGSLSPAFMEKGKNRQYALLKAEGVAFTRDGRVKMDKYEWNARGVAAELFKKYGL